MWKLYGSRLECNELVGTRLGRRELGGSRLGWRELVGCRLGRREHDGSRLRSTIQLHVARRGSRIQRFKGAGWIQAGRLQAGIKGAQRLQA